MSLYHGTSAGTALKILETNTVLPSKDGLFYCFNSDKPESMAGAICFATGGTLRNGSINTVKFLSYYKKLNPAFPKGLKGAFVTAGLQLSIKSWTKSQRHLAVPPYDYHAAILVFKKPPVSKDLSRGGFINETVVPDFGLSALQVEKAYFDDTLLNRPEIKTLKDKGVVIEPLSQWAAQVAQDVAVLETAKKNQKMFKGPKA